MTEQPIDLIAQLEYLFKPRSIAVIGASNSPWKWGYWMVDRPLTSGYRGAIYPINLDEPTIHGLRAYRSILDIADDVDLAVIAVPARAVVETMEACAQKGVKAAIVISAGFAEVGAEGRELERRLLAVARSAGIRFLGPNCMGMYSAAGGLNLCFPQAPHRGRISFITQSGTFGMFLAQMAAAKGYGLSKVMSIGNQVDLATADYIEYLGQDADTSAIVIYMEGVVQGRRLLAAARHVAGRKPIIVYKGGRTSVGARATFSHTASLAGDDVIFEAFCKQVGVIRAYEAMHPFDMAEALVSSPLPAGYRVGVVSGGGGHCVATADACGSLGLELPELLPEDQAAIHSLLSPWAPPPRNPVDLAGGGGDIGTIARIADALAKLPYIDAVITSPPMGRWGRGDLFVETRQALDALEMVLSIPKRLGKPVILNAMRMIPTGVGFDIIRQTRIPTYETPEESARAMWALCRYAEVRRELGGD